MMTPGIDERRSLQQEWRIAARAQRTCTSVSTGQDERECDCEIKSYGKLKKIDGRS